MQHTIEAEPLAHLTQHRRTGRGAARKQSPGVRRATFGRRELAGGCGGDQSFVRRARRDQVRKRIRELVRGQLHAIAATAVTELREVEERGGLQHRTQRELDALCVRAVGRCEVVERDQIGDLVAFERPPESARAERFDEAASARFAVGRVGTRSKLREAALGRSRKRLGARVQLLHEHGIHALRFIAREAVLTRVGRKRNARRDVHTQQRLNRRRVLGRGEAPNPGGQKGLGRHVPRYGRGATAADGAARRARTRATRAVTSCVGTAGVCG
jgi:hypothetical protein